MKIYRKFVILNTKNNFKDSDDVYVFEKNRKLLLENNNYGLLNTKEMIEDLLMCSVAVNRLNNKLNKANETIKNYFVEENRQSDTLKKLNLEHENIKLKNEIKEKDKIIESNKESFIYKNDRIKALNEIVENDKEIIAKLNKELRDAENKIKKGALTKVVDRENFFSHPMADYINKRFELVKNIDDNKIAEAFNIKSFEQLENENKSLRGQIKKQTSVIKELRVVRKNDFYVEVLERKNSSLNDKIVNQADTIEYLMNFRKEIIEILTNNTQGLTMNNKIIDVVRKYNGGDE